MSNRRDIQFVYTPHNKATILDCSWTVADTNGAGVTGLQKSGRIASVFMHTATTPSTGNPNPAAGYVIVNLQDNYNSYFGSYAQIRSPLSGSGILIASSSVLTVGQVYQITVMGTSTQANWVAIGLPSYITAAVGVSFVASVTGGGTGTGQVQLPATAGSAISRLELVGSPNLMNSNGAYVASGGTGMQLIYRCMGSSFAGSALGSHTHDFIVKGGQAGSTTNNIANYAGPLIGKQEATDATYLGANSATSGGVVAASAGTPAGSVSGVTTAPAAGTIIYLAMYFNNSAQGV